MAEQQVRIRLAVDGTGEAVTNLEKVQKATAGVGEKAKQAQGLAGKFGSQIAGSFNIAAMAAGAASALLMGSVKSAMDSQRAMQRLSGTVGDAAGELQRFAAARMKATVYDDDATISAMSLIGTYTKETDEIKRLTVAAQDLSSKFQIDLETAARTLMLAMEGNTRGLKKFGIQVDSAKPSVDELNDAIKKIAGGFAEAEAATDAGKMLQAANEWGESGERIGNAFLPLAPLFEVTAAAIGSMVQMTITGITSLIEASKALMLEPLWSDDTWSALSDRVVGTGNDMSEAAIRLEETLGFASTQAENFASGLSEGMTKALDDAAVKAYDAAAGVETLNKSLAEVSGTSHITDDEIDAVIEQFEKQAESAQTNDLAILKLQKDHSPLIASLGLETSAQKANREEMEKATDAREKSRAKIKEEAAARAEAIAQRQIEAMLAAKDAEFQTALPEGIDPTKEIPLPPEFNETIDDGTEAVKRLNQSISDSALVSITDMAAKKNQQQTVVQGTSAMLGAFSQLAGQNKKMQLVAKRMAQGQVVIDTYTAATAALKNPPGPPFTIPFALAAVAMGLANLRVIEQQQFASGGYVHGHGGGRSDMVAANLSAGEGVLTAATVARIGGEAAVNALNAGAGAGGGGIVINFTGPVTDRAYVRDYIVPEVRRAVGRGVA